jgi:hypothetical protein
MATPSVYNLALGTRRGKGNVYFLAHTRTGEVVRTGGQETGGEGPRARNIETDRVCDQGTHSSAILASRFF